jgi:hypothetical protein
MAGNDDIDHLLANRQLLLVSVEPFPAMDEHEAEQSASRTVFVNIGDAIAIQRKQYERSIKKIFHSMTDRDLLLDYMANNWARLFTIHGKVITESELFPQTKPEEKPGPFFYCCMAVLVVLLVITARYALMFAESAINQ